MKFILIISLILLLAFLSKTQATKTIGSCGCTAKAAIRCGIEESQCQKKCVNRFLARCSRRCEEIKRILPQTDCQSKSLSKCGSDASIKTRLCRNKAISRCVRKFQNKSVTTVTTTHVKRHLNQTHLKKVSRKVALKKCGPGPQNLACRKQISTYFKIKETKFRKTALVACACEAKVCHSTDLNKCKRKISKCRAQCLKSACKTRAVTSCASRTTGKKVCSRRVKKRCLKVHYSRTVEIKQVTKSKKSTKKVRKLRKTIRKLRKEKKNCQKRVTKRIKKSIRKLRKQGKKKSQENSKKLQEKFTRNAKELQLKNVEINLDKKHAEKKLEKSTEK